MPSWASGRLRLTSKCAYPGDFSFDVRTPNWIDDAPEAHAGKQVREIVGPLLDADNFTDLESVPKVTHDDAMFGISISFDHDLPAVGEIAGLAVILQRNRTEETCIETLQRCENLTKNCNCPTVDGIQIRNRLVGERDSIELSSASRSGRRSGTHSSSRSMPKPSATSRNDVRFPLSAEAR